MDLLHEIIDAQKKAREETGRKSLEGRHNAVFQYLPKNVQDFWTLDVMEPLSTLSGDILKIADLITASGKGYMIRRPPPIDEELYWRLVKEAKTDWEEAEAKKKVERDKKKVPRMIRKRLPTDPPQQRHLLRVSTP